MNERLVGVLGAMSLVGGELLPLLVKKSWRVTAYSRQRVKVTDTGVEWRQIDEEAAAEQMASSQFQFVVNSERCAHPSEIQAASWICLVPIWVLPNYFDLLAAQGARRVVVLSSTSRFTKSNSSDLQEQVVAQRLAAGEDRFVNWAAKYDIQWVILRPTLVYGNGRDKNIAEIARFIRRFGFFPLLGEAKGLRQPVHAEDVAAACVSALDISSLSSRAYNLSGGETLTYRDMVKQVFVALGRRPMLVTIAPWLFRSSVRCLRQLPRYRHLSYAMAERMNQDLVFGHAEAARDLSFSPRKFRLGAEDVWV